MNEGGKRFPLHFSHKIQSYFKSYGLQDDIGFAMKIEWIKIEAIKPNRRCICEAESIEQLIISIRKIGQREPIKIWFTGEDFRIIDGEKRWRACKKIGLTKIKAIILEIET